MGTGATATVGIGYAIGAVVPIAAAIAATASFAVAIAVATVVGVNTHLLIAATLQQSELHMLQLHSSMHKPEIVFLDIACTDIRDDTANLV
jgi:hypothetical protein